jgi:uncharacterized protein YcfJ
MNSPRLLLSLLFVTSSIYSISTYADHSDNFRKHKLQHYSHSTSNYQSNKHSNKHSGKYSDKRSNKHSNKHSTKHSYIQLNSHSNNYLYNHKNNQHHNNRGHSYYDFASVRSVSPITQQIEHRVPYQCDHGNVNHQYERSSNTPMIIGTILGAAIGNELGHKKINQKVGAIAGGILGASVAKDIYKDNPGSNHRCQNYRIKYEERVVGYDVSYSYRGNIYHTTTREHPGRRIQIKLRFDPVFS